MDDGWSEILDSIDWDSVDREVGNMKGHDDLVAYLEQDKFDYKRSYIRKLMQAHPEITDRNVIALATEQMLESHDGGVELDVDDALRFVANQKPMSVSEAVKIFTDMGINDSNIADVIFGADLGVGQTIDGVKNPDAKRKAQFLTRYADILARNPDVLLLGIPVFDPESNWTQAKLAFFSEDLSDAEKNVLKMMMNTADESRMKVEHGVAVAVFQILNIWSNFE